MAAPLFAPADRRAAEDEAAQITIKARAAAFRAMED